MSDLVTNIQGYSIHDGPGIRTVVFLKGCSLACRWCSNPECISPKPEVGFVASLCTRCGACAGVCPENALHQEGDRPPVIERSLCTGCGKCAAACTYGALVLYGTPMEPDEVFDAVRRDNIFYAASGGGVTVSGGEALLKPRFVAAVFEACRRDGLSTCVETSGQAPEAALREVLPLTDLLLFDLKLMDPARHAAETGSPNDRILANARVAAASGAPLLFRMPLVPGVNDDEPNIRATAAFIRSLGSRTPGLQLMPYHRFGKGKYDSLGRPYPLAGLPAPAKEQVRAVQDIFIGLGVACTVSE
jgi:pyruvate formate lyase activating enzyme